VEATHACWFRNSPCHPLSIIGNHTMNKSNRPKLVVFDLDFTVWYPEMYELEGAPFKKCSRTGRVTDRDNEEVQIFDDMHEIFKALHTSDEFENTKVAVASSTTYPEWARECMRLLHVQDIDVALETVIHYRQAIYPRNKKVHFNELREASGIDFKDMLFFDNERYNIREVGELGVTCVYCPDGMSMEHWERGLDAFHQMSPQND